MPGFFENSCRFRMRGAKISCIWNYCFVPPSHSFKSVTLSKVRNINYFDRFLKNFDILDEPCFNTEITQVETHRAYTNIPLIVVECVKILENNDGFMKTIGLYRISGDHKIIQTFRYQVIFFCNFLAKCLSLNIFF